MPALDFVVEAIGFEAPEIDLRIQSLDTTSEDAADSFEVAAGVVPENSIQADSREYGES